MFGDKYDLQLSAYIGLSDEPQSRWIGCVVFPFVDEIPAIVIHEALINFILRDVVFGREFLLNLG